MRIEILTGVSFGFGRGNYYYLMFELIVYWGSNRRRRMWPDNGKDNINFVLNKRRECPVSESAFLPSMRLSFGRWKVTQTPRGAWRHRRGRRAIAVTHESVTQRWQVSHSPEWGRRGGGGPTILAKMGGYWHFYPHQGTGQMIKSAYTHINLGVIKIKPKPE